MDDTTPSFNVDLRGEVIPSRPLTADQLMAVTHLRKSDHLLTMKMIGALLTSALGKDVWTDLLLRQASGEITTKDMVNVLDAVVAGSAEELKRQADAAKNAPQIQVRPETVTDMAAPESPNTVPYPVAEITVPGAPPVAEDVVPRTPPGTFVPQTFRAGD